MQNTTYKFLDFPAYIDESIGSLDTPNPYYVMSAVIFLGRPAQALMNFHEADLKLGFKTSKYATPKKQGKLRSYGSWMAGQDFMAICVAIPLNMTSQEVLRRSALMYLLEHLSLLGIEEFKMDSRDELTRKNRHLNIYDQTTLTYLQRINTAFSRSNITFHNDNEDFRFSMTDFVAWNTRRYLSGVDIHFTNYLQNRLEIFVLPAQKDRGQPLPL